MMKDAPVKYQIWQPMLLAVVLAVGMLIGTRIDDQLPQEWVEAAPGTGPWDKVVHTVRFIESRYGEEVDADSISDATIDFIMSHLDPHSYYQHGLDYRYFKERMQGSYEGIGIEYDRIDDTVVVVNVMDGPARDAGLRPGDMILKINDQPVSGPVSAEESYKIWKEAGDSYEILLLPLLEGSVKSLKIEKAPVQVDAIPFSTHLDEKVGYIRIGHFANRVYQDFMSHLEALAEQGLDDLIIDVRDNPGGSFQEVIKILNQLVLEKDELMVYMEGKHLKRTEYKSTGKPFFQIKNIAVLVNEHSASASEVLSGVLQDLDRARVIGRRTFGKALVQETYEVGEDASINLTIGKYYLPSGRFIQKAYADRETYDGDLQGRIDRGELLYADSIPTFTEDSPSIDGDAIAATGEGIIPDLFVPVDSFWYSSFWQENKNRLHADAFRFYRQHRRSIDEAMSGEDFREAEIRAMILEHLQQQVADTIPEESLQSLSRAYLEGIMRYAWSEDQRAGWQVRHDQMVLAALEWLNSPNTKFE